jgi:hypothetical protein
MRNKNKLGEDFDSGECTEMEGAMKPFPVFTSANAQQVHVAAFKKHFVYIPPSQSFAPKAKGMASMLEKGNARRAAPI